MGARHGFLITFEGLDGCGKTTQIEALSAYLLATGRDFIVTRQPGGTETGDRIRAMLLDSKSKGIFPLTELALMFSDRAQCVEEIILPALHAGKIVLCDRFTDSSEAYQGGGREMGHEIVHSLHRILCGDLQPDLTFLLLGDPGVTLARARERNIDTEKDESRFEHEQAAFHERVLHAYLAIAERDRHRVVKIDASKSIDSIREDIARIFEQRLASMCANS